MFLNVHQLDQLARQHKIEGNSSFSEKAEGVSQT